MGTNDSWWKEEEKPVRYDKDGKVIWWEDDEKIIDNDSWWKDCIK